MNTVTYKKYIYLNFVKDFYLIFYNMIRVSSPSIVLRYEIIHIRYETVVNLIRFR